MPSYMADGVKICLQKYSKTKVFNLLYYNFLIFLEIFNNISKSKTRKIYKDLLFNK